MKSDVSEQAVSSWNEVIRRWEEYIKARYNLHLNHRSELLALVDHGLKSAGGVYLAFEMIAVLTEEEKRTLLPTLLGWCYSMEYSRKARELILKMPQEWLIENIEVAAEPTLANNDFLDWVNILSLYTDIDLDLGRRLAKRMLVHPDKELQEWGEEFLKDHAGT